MDLSKVVRLMGAAIADDRPDLPKRLCAAFTEGLDGQGAALALTADRTLHRTLAASGPDAAKLVELEFTLGVGPGLEAASRCSPVLVEDLTSTENVRWPIWSASVAAHGLPARAVFAFPLQVAGTAFGVIELYRDRPGLLDEHDTAAAAIAADLTALALARSYSASPTEEPPDWWRRPELDGVEVDQAIGMVMAQLRAPADTALATLRARAFAEGRPLDELARDVLDRKIVFGPGDPEGA